MPHLPLIRPLFEGPIDVIGDVHGELGALEQLLLRLGYDAGGLHPEGRRMVFVGDLVDRGPNSPGVVDRVIEWCGRGRAECLLGNHELNLLNAEVKHGNRWFQHPSWGDAPAKVAGMMPATASQRDRFTRFFDQRPLALERDDVRIVHACWQAEKIAELRALGPVDGVRSVYAGFNARVKRELDREHVSARKKTELASHTLDDRAQPPPWLEALAENDLRRQMGNPIRVLTSGPEAEIQPPFWASGKWRMVSRSPWWDDYDDDTPVIFGHYWRRPRGVMHEADGGPDLFRDVEREAWMGKRRNVFCVDYSVGQRYIERSEGTQKNFKRRLAALRLPEWSLHYDDGEHQPLSAPKGAEH